MSAREQDRRWVGGKGGPRPGPGRSGPTARGPWPWHPGTWLWAPRAAKAGNRAAPPPLACCPRPGGPQGDFGHRRCRWLPIEELWPETFTLSWKLAAATTSCRKRPLLTNQFLGSRRNRINPSGQVPSCRGVFRTLSPPRQRGAVRGGWDRGLLDRTSPWEAAAAPCTCLRLCAPPKRGRVYRCWNLRGQERRGSRS